MIKIKKIDLTGERFGKLTVIEKGSGYISPSGSKSTTWICKCDCGNTTVVRASSSKFGKDTPASLGGGLLTNECGCKFEHEVLENAISREKHTRDSKRITMRSQYDTAQAWNECIVE